MLPRVALIAFCQIQASGNEAVTEESILVGAKRLPVWPEGQEITALDDEGTVLRTRFADFGNYHPALTTRTLEPAERPDLSRQRARSMGGTKLYCLHEWNCPEAELIDARAVALFKRAMGETETAVDLSWANVYRRGDYIMPHSHVRARASVVYVWRPARRTRRTPAAASSPSPIPATRPAAWPRRAT